MANIKLIATDLDGTFLSDDKTFDKSLFQKVLKILKEKNITFAVATGVHQERINRILANFLEYDIAYVTNNGARIVNDHGQILYEKSLDIETLGNIQNLLSSFNPIPDQGVVYSTEDTAYVPREFAQFINEKHMKYFRDVIIVDDVTEIFDPIFKVTVNWDDFDETRFYKVVKHELANTVHVTETGTGAIDIVPANINKAVGLKILADNLNIQLNDIVAFGDGGNDFEMLNSVGKPYIMPNARLHGKYLPVLEDNNHDGVLKTILSIL
ncbi:Cof-type HAD-IIB family hydrolase [Leuconostoc palmae]|uniref:Cof-type HAD-IIB family hydrolase n=1 Tax=Leuconostoc palmae TaxID=501487 RepID=UPI001C7CAF78|nr:HAD family hydrolase [Leuconostoc palmae]